LEAVASGGGVVVDVSMQACAASLAPRAGPSPAAAWDDEGWHVVVDGVRVPVRDAAGAAQPAR
jgi:hypothetical protein